MSALVWPIKGSLIGYVRGMSDGRVELDGGAQERDGAFVFPAADAPGQFAGSVTFLGHNGMMRVLIADPWLRADGSGAVLSIADPDDPSTRLDFARIATFDGRAASGTTLTGDGADLFFGPYVEGTVLDDPRIEE